VIQKRPDAGDLGAETKHVNREARSYTIIVGVLILLSPGLVFANNDEEAPDPTMLSAYDSGWLTSDRDEDGRIDYAVQVDERGYKIREALDFNYDGHMDDFYFYSNNVLQRQEIDSNFDRMIDIWIYMWRGVFVRRWERDTNFDGSVDLIRDYDDRQQ